MKKVNYENKSVLVLGIAKSGFAAAKLLRSLGATVTVNDREQVENNPKAIELQELGFEVIGGGHPLELLEGIDLIVKNPGIPYQNPLLVEAVKRDIPIVTEVEIAGEISEAPFIAITGSNGKTTTTTLIGQLLNQTPANPIVAGNIGTVVCEVAAEATPDQTLVTELSSFQLQGTVNFHPHISVLLNLYEAHLDYHGTKDAYAAAKARMFQNQTHEDFAVYNADDSLVSSFAEASKASLVPFSATKTLDDGVSIEDSWIVFRKEKVIKIDELSMKQNIENTLAAIAVAKLSGVSNEKIHQELTNFHGVKHRLQFVGEVSGRKFFNDSKATNSIATKKALDSFEKPVILLAGGLDRGNDFDDLNTYFQTKVKHLITFGETASKLKQTANQAGLNSVTVVDNVEEAVSTAYHLSETGDVILLSPACASWDQFKTFEERGDIFIEAMHRL
ncbi:UDP-N-acetylmuramoyl-L-alanine--D-glutamate ligase [Bacillus sp. N1-1]|jgi:UDP-N-acetylmuramoylalanine--D-glutamate ligase|uniref:UDP-N-acetylmuramoyl-L-alanine--D-glutamate ligase n=1 Tax=Bacillus sp. N1-1 TaxID=2682541 RepID=UPI0013163DDF|nr:UDP-N-acetylmuramoyl-L-alanine--D-glutamate ligase [Bacillus sp. N1-1]QHA91706.1 UDP-N-acetylmuramoyl-L-alanine--D-glutamate ligase [Bacillus sp. N1-1]